MEEVHAGKCVRDHIRQPGANQPISIKVQKLSSKAVVSRQERFLVTRFRDGLPRPSPAVMHVLVVCVIEPQMIPGYGRGLNYNANLRIVLHRAPLTARRLELVDIDSQAAAFHALGARGPEEVLAETPPASTQEIL